MVDDAEIALWLNDENSLLAALALHARDLEPYGLKTESVYIDVGGMQQVQRVATSASALPAVVGYVTARLERAGKTMEDIVCGRLDWCGIKKRHGSLLALINIVTGALAEFFDNSDLLKICVTLLGTREFFDALCRCE